MSPDERQLLTSLFDRIRNASNQTRDRDAETFIGDAVRVQPYAPYLLAQTVIVQDQALRAANERLQELERTVQELQSNQQQGGSGGGSFLGGLGRSIFGQGQPDPQSRNPMSQAGYGQQGPGGQPGYGQQQGGFGGQQQAGGPWGQAGGMPGAGGGFLKGALGAAAGVAGGVLLANSISGLFHGNNSLGIASGMPGFGGGLGGGGLGGGSGETIVNNYYENDGQDGGNADNGGFGTADFGSDDGGGSDDSYNV